jgi:L,D-transpeptidase ErfK/SrfK
MPRNSPVSPDALMFGDIETITTFSDDTLPDLARRYSLGYEEIQRANPSVDVWLPGEGTTLLIPGQRLLPPGPREGIVVNLPEHRLYYYPKVKKGETPYVITYPVSIGKMDWNTPLGKTRVVDKRKNPLWYPPESVRKEHAERGDPLPAVVKAGPDNPLGAYAMRLDIHPGAYLIHGTNNPIAVGMAITHGCIRMYPEDIEALFPLVPVNTPVWLVNEPVKVARVNGQVWLEVHPPVDAEGQRAEVDLEGFYALANAALGETPAAILGLRARRPAGGIGTAADGGPGSRPGRGAASTTSAAPSPARSSGAARRALGHPPGRLTQDD